MHEERKTQGAAACPNKKTAGPKPRPAACYRPRASDTAARSWRSQGRQGARSKLGTGQAAPCAVISSSRRKAAFHSHLPHATRIISCGSSAKAIECLLGHVVAAPSRRSRARIGQHVGPPLLGDRFLWV